MFDVAFANVIDPSRGTGRVIGIFALNATVTTVGGGDGVAVGAIAIAVPLELTVVVGGVSVFTFVIKTP